PSHSDLTASSPHRPPAAPPKQQDPSQQALLRQYGTSTLPPRRTPVPSRIAGKPRCSPRRASRSRSASSTVRSLRKLVRALWTDSGWVAPVDPVTSGTEVPVGLPDPAAGAVAWGDPPGCCCPGGSVEAPGELVGFFCDGIWPRMR